MRGLRIIVSLVVVVIGVPAIVSAQASIAGQVKDATGGVLPGVTVEASSPALIEKVRSVVTAGTGQYRIELLPPGTYTVTFALPGFSTVKREGMQLTGTFTATIDAELRVGRGRRKRSPSPVRRRSSTCRAPTSSASSTAS